MTGLEIKVFQSVVDCIRQGEPAALVTVLSLNETGFNQSGRMLVRADGSFFGNIGGGNFQERMRTEAWRSIESMQARRFLLNLKRDSNGSPSSMVEVLIEPIRPEPRFVIFGTGPVAQHVSALLVELGFAITLLDTEDAEVLQDRFVGCSILQGNLSELVGQLDTTNDMFVLLATEDQNRDRILLERLVMRPWRWLGVAASRSQGAMHIAFLKASGLDESSLERLSIPAGLRIGAETPEEMAVSIAAEVVRERSTPRKSKHSFPMSRSSLGADPVPSPDDI